MSTTPTPTVAATTHPSCPRGWACDTPDGQEITAVAWFVIAAVVVLGMAAFTGRRRS